MQILDFKSRVFLAPMAGITDLPMRRLVSSCGEGVMVSEMVAINALSRRNPKTYKIADVRNEPYPVVVQLVGSDPALGSPTQPNWSANWELILWISIWDARFAKLSITNPAHI